MGLFERRRRGSCGDVPRELREPFRQYTERCPSDDPELPGDGVHLPGERVGGAGELLGARGLQPLLPATQGALPHRRRRDFPVLGRRDANGRRRSKLAEAARRGPVGWLPIRSKSGSAAVVRKTHRFQKMR